jgi:hypothetical protein
MIGLEDGRDFRHDEEIAYLQAYGWHFQRLLLSTFGYCYVYKTDALNIILSTHWTRVLRSQFSKSCLR